jgi:hypothetical protein
LTILSIDANNNKTYKCKQCGKIFRGQPCSVGSHFLKGFSSQEVQACLTKFKSLPLELQQEINNGKKEKAEKVDNKRKYNLQFVTNPSSDIRVQLGHEKKPFADAMVLKYVVTQGASHLTFQISFHTRLLWM